MYKLKTKKSLMKRFKVSKFCKLLRRKASKSHLLSKKNSERKLNLRKVVHVHYFDKSHILKNLPYL